MDELMKSIGENVVQGILEEKLFWGVVGRIKCIHGNIKDRNKVIGIVKDKLNQQLKNKPTLNVDIGGFVEYLNDTGLKSIKDMILDMPHKDKYLQNILYEVVKFSSQEDEKKALISLTLELMQNIKDNLYAKLSEGEKVQLGIIDDKLSWLEAKIDKISAPQQEKVKLHSAPGQVEDKYFVGRAELMKDLKGKLQNNNNLMLVNGLGGIGKSTIAKRLFHDIKSEYDISIWINFRNSLKDSILSVSGFSEIQDENIRYNAICNYLMGEKNRIIFVDNVPENIDISALSSMADKVILTSRLEKIVGYNRFQVPPLDEEACIELFKAYHGETDELEWVKKIIALSGRHTLCIELIASLIENSDYDVEEFHQELVRNGFDCSGIEIECGHNKNNEKLAEHVRKLFDLSSLNEEEVRILQNFACMPNIPLPRELKEWINMNEKDSAKLKKLSWISYDKHERTFDMHPIVKESIRLNGIAENIGIELLECVASGNYFKYDKDFETHEKVKVKLQILETFLYHIKKEKNELFGAVYNAISFFFNSQGDYKKALEYYKKSLEIREKVLGKEHPDTATSYNNIASVYRTQGDYKKALEYLEKSLEIHENVLGKEHPDIATSYNNIATVYETQGDYKKVLEYLEKSLEIREKVLGNEHPDTSTCYNNIGLVYETQGDYEKALEYLEKSLEIKEKVLGKEHPDTSTSYNNIGQVYYTQSNYKKALEYYEKSLEISEKVLGKEHPSTATSYNNIATVYEIQSDYKKALEYYEKSLEIHEKVLGKEHPDTATSYNNIASVYDNQGDYKKALEYFEKSLEIIEKVLGKEHQYTATSYNNIASVYDNQGDYKKALEYYEKSLEIKEKILGKEHPDTATSYNNIASVYEPLCNYKKALEYYEKSLEIYEKVLGKEHSDTATSYNNIASVYYTQGNYKKALEYYEKSLEIIEKVLGKEHPYTASSYNNIATVYSTQGDYKSTIELFKKAYIIFKKVLGSEHPKTQNALNGLSICFSKLGYSQEDFDLWVKNNL